MRKKIILIENDTDLAEGLKVLLREAGLELVILNKPARLNGVIPQQKPLVLIIDYFLPGTDGLSLVRRLRKEGFRLPIIIISAIHTHMEKEAGKAGANHFLPKPFNFEELLELIKKFSLSGGSRSRGPKGSVSF